MSHYALDHLLADLRRLTTPGVLGFYSQFEVTEILGVPTGQPPFNVLTVLVAQEHASDPAPRFIGDRIQLRGLKNMKFGVLRYTRTLQQVLAAVEDLRRGEPWALAGEPLALAVGRSIPPALAPSDGFKGVPLNAILKNNFWDGSYVLELFDETKSLVADLLTRPTYLMSLSEEISMRVPIHIAGLSDRLGNLLFQLPVEILRSRTRRSPEGIDVEIAWHPRATPRDLEVHAMAHRDQLVTGHTIVQLDSPKVHLSLPNSQDPYHVNIWDPQNQILLGASGERVHLQQATYRATATGAAARLMTLPDGEQQRIPISYVQAPTVLGAAREHQRWTQERLYSEEAASLARSRRFRQYSASGAAASAHVDALGDLRHLIGQYGQQGVWLWDPYLSAEDIIKTLFFNPFADAPMRALASARKGSGLEGKTNLDWIATQKALLSNCHSNYHGLKLEYRALHEGAGWDFHDRFLIFPNVEGRSLAWSLGISVNQAGQSHHILQQVDNGRLVAEAFDQLWNELDSKQILWKWPMDRNVANPVGPGSNLEAMS